MGNLHLVTGYAGQEHVTSADVGALNALMYGSGQYLLATGNQMAASVITSNTIRILDGEILMQGRHIRLEKDTYVDLTIENGTQGYSRNDLIVARYQKDSVSGVESVNLVVIKGENATSNPPYPEYTKGDILGGALMNDMPLYRVPIDGLNVGNPVNQLVATDISVIKLNEDKQNRTDLLAAVTALADDDGFPFYDASAKSNKKTTWSNIKTVLGKVFASVTHAHAATDITSGVLPVARGGTGNSSMASFMNSLAANAMGCRIQVGSYVGTGTYGVDNPTTINLSFQPKMLIIEADGKYQALNGNNSGPRLIVAMYGMENQYVTYSMGNQAGSTVFAWNGTAVSWYGTALNAAMNTAGTTHRWAVIG